MLYPVILAVGYLLGFQGLNLGLWAMIIGMAALYGSLLLIYALAKAYDAPEWLAVLMGLAPETFWRLSLKEWRMLTEAPSADQPMRRNELDRMAEAWPDD